MKFAALVAVALISVANAADRDPAAESSDFAQVRSLYQQGLYFRAARASYQLLEKRPSAQAESYSWIALSLSRAGMHHAASYFFIRTLQSGDNAAIRRVTRLTPELLLQDGADLYRKYLIRHTKYDDYESESKSAFLYALGKSALLEGQWEKAAGYVSGMQTGSALFPFALQVRASAYAIMGKNEEAIVDFQACQDRAGGVASRLPQCPKDIRLAVTNPQRFRRDAEDLRARCQAGEARTLYQMERFEEADRAYDLIAKKSFVWPDILFEQAWNSFARQEYNRALGKLVSYKSPALSFVFNSEVDVLKAQTYYMLCLFRDSNDTINDFNRRNAKVGENVKKFVESTGNNLQKLYEFGVRALRDSIYTRNDMHRMANRFVRGPYFQGLVEANREIERERVAVRQFASAQEGSSANLSSGFPGFLNQVLSWRQAGNRALGGVFVKNSLIDYHTRLIGDFEKMAFVKLEMLKRVKDELLQRPRSSGERQRGNVIPTRRDDQYYWSFNGEFWNDELGDYVFGLESQCGGKSGDAEGESSQGASNDN